MRKLWVLAIKKGRHDSGELWYPSKYSLICNDHFTENDYVIQSLESVAAGISCKRLKRGAIPSVFLRKQQNSDEKGNLEITSDAPACEVEVEGVNTEDEKCKDGSAGITQHRQGLKSDVELPDTSCSTKEDESLSVRHKQEKAQLHYAEILRRKEAVLGISLEFVEEKSNSGSGNVGQSLDAEDMHIENEYLTWEEELSQSTNVCSDLRNSGDLRHSLDKTVKLRETKNRLINFKNIVDFVGTLACPKCIFANCMKFKSETKCLVSFAVLWKFQCMYCGYDTVLRDSKIVKTRSAKLSPYSRNELLSANTILSYSGFSFMKHIMDRLEVPFGEDEVTLLEAVHCVQLMGVNQETSSITLSVGRIEENCGKGPLDKNETDAASFIAGYMPLSVVKNIQKNEENKMIENVLRRLLVVAAIKISNQLVIKKKKVATVIDYVSRRFGVRIDISSNTLPVRNINSLVEDDLDIKNIKVKSH